ncbi:MAG: DeoR/GlpR family DNA-binding transcription regulator [Leptotrichiaceae bacterium]|nr:DeoR/GlpR family DNA-binding transcription regulator [Leptotrichiaceae bacterium]
MFLDERLEKILEILKREKKVKVNELSEEFRVSEVIIRKDLKRLELEGKLKRTHGGAILLKELVHTITLEDRIINRTKQKEIIAKKIIENINEGERIFFDVSSINYIAAEYLSNSEKSLNLFTNMPSIAALFNKNSRIKLTVIGGDYHKEIGGIIGSEAINNIVKYNVDKSFIGCAGIDSDTGKVMNFESNDGNTKKAIINISTQRFLITELRKFESEGSFNFGNLKEFTVILSEKRKADYPSILRKKLQEFDLEIG